MAARPEPRPTGRGWCCRQGKAPSEPPAYTLRRVIQRNQQKNLDPTAVQLQAIERFSGSIVGL
jgi:hypothetical protein